MKIGRDHVGDFRVLGFLFVCSRFLFYFLAKKSINCLCIWPPKCSKLVKEIEMIPLFQPVFRDNPKQRKQVAEWIFTYFHWESDAAFPRFRSALILWLCSF